MVATIDRTRLPEKYPREGSDERLPISTISGTGCLIILVLMTSRFASLRTCCKTARNVVSLIPFTPLRSVRLLPERSDGLGFFTVVKGIGSRTTIMRLGVPCDSAAATLSGRMPSFCRGVPESRGAKSITPIAAAPTVTSGILALPLKDMRSLLSMFVGALGAAPVPPFKFDVHPKLQINLSHLADLAFDSEESSTPFNDLSTVTG